jgi:hypothetical protein
MDGTPVVGNPMNILHVRRAWKNKESADIDITSFFIYKLMCILSLVRSNRTEILLEIFSINIRRSNILKPTTGDYFL